MVSTLLIIDYFSFEAFAVVLLLAAQVSNGKNARYRACSNLHSCGKIRNIDYPFWGGDRPKYCGISDLKLSCEDGQDYPTINVFQDGFFPLRVLSIDTDSHIMVISQVELFERCHSQELTAIKDQLSPAEPYSHIQQLNLYYGCSSSCDSVNQAKSFVCSNTNGSTTNNAGTVYYTDNTSVDFQWRNTLTFPVDKRVISELENPRLLKSNQSTSLASILSAWPTTQMEYKADLTACFMCKRSGGRCGSSENLSSDKFVCYCPHGPQPLTCSGFVAALLGIVILAALIICAKRRSATNDKCSFLWSRKTTKDHNVEAFLKSYRSLAPTRYSYANLKKITNSFKDKLGEGGYGSVYKGKLPDGRLVAVKKMKNLKGDGKDFINEVLSISRANHVNVVTLLGFCVEGTKRALVFEFMPNGSLEKFVYGVEISPPLHWHTMLNIALGIARGLDYLHRGCTTRILHFDIKPHNILLDEEFRPKISDFGLARVCSPEHSLISMSEARGTIGYIAPEVFCRNFGGISHKSDVYSYGMMLIDLVCGRNKLASNADEFSSEMYFPDWIYNQLEPIIDDAEVTIQEITENEDKKLKRRMILVSLWCIQPYPSNRPPISRVVEMLEGSLESLQMPPKPQRSSPPVPYASDSSSAMLQSLASKDYENI